jgi:NADH:ubiquinone oxidoreductase subunit F (NADH-binding)
MLQEKRIVLRNSGIIDPEGIEGYIQKGGYQALAKALTMESSQVIEEVVSSGLRGRGGAGFPTGIKMKSTAQSITDGIKYIVCNADEGEPGTFKDRIIMETDPHGLIEGMIIAGWSVGASKGYIYIRGEYQKSIKRVKKAIELAELNGYLGESILYSSFNFSIEIRIGAGSYLCGEELTLLESIEGKRGYPRIKPPFPAQKGLWGNPTLINNVETLTNIAPIILNGSQWFRSFGTEKSPGTKVFTLSGDISNPGHYEVEMGVTLEQVINDLGGGIKGNLPMKAALLGGAAGTFASTKHLSVQLDYDSLKDIGLTLGSGAIIVMNENRSILDMLSNILGFFKHESCGKCIPCRLGTTHTVSILQKINGMNPADRRLAFASIINQAELMAKTSLCPLGQSPILPIKSAWNSFEDELINFSY